MKHYTMNEETLINEYQNMDQKSYDELISEAMELKQAVEIGTPDIIAKSVNILSLITNVAKTGKLSFKQFKVVKYFIDNNTKYKRFEPYWPREVD